MLRASLLLATLALTLADIAAADDKQPAAPGPLEGAWKLTSVLLNAQALPMEKLQDARLVVRGTKYSLKLADTRLEMTHALLNDQRPRAMDLTVVEGPDKGKTFHAIIKLADDTLTVCRSIQPDKERPTEFASKPDSGLLLVVWTRQKAQ
jgi:uncharacterized protein (TIGR03067 family)